MISLLKQFHLARRIYTYNISTFLRLFFFFLGGGGGGGVDSLLNNMVSAAFRAVYNAGPLLDSCLIRTVPGFTPLLLILFYNIILCKYIVNIQHM